MSVFDELWSHITEAPKRSVVPLLPLLSPSLQKAAPEAPVPLFSPYVQDLRLAGPFNNGPLPPRSAAAPAAFVSGPAYQGTGEDIDRFMAAIRQRESGGNYAWNPNPIGARGAYQFMPGTWRSSAGATAGDTSPANQDRVARQSMMGLYNKYHDWGKVAEAWLGGEGSIGKNVSDGSTTTSAYARDVLKLMGQPVAPRLPNPIPAAPALEHQLEYNQQQQQNAESRLAHLLSADQQPTPVPQNSVTMTTPVPQGRPFQPNEYNDPIPVRGAY